MDAAQQPLLAQVVEVLADGLRCDPEMGRQIVDKDATRVLGHLEDFSMSSRQEHETTPVFVFSLI